MIQKEILKKHCWWKDLTWLKKRINKRLVNNNVDILIEHLIPILNLVYGDNWDIQFEFINPSEEYIDYDLNRDNPKHRYKGLVPYTMNIVIHYPEIQIINSNNLVHTIKNLYVRIPIFICNLRVTTSEEGQYNKPFIKKIEGYRFTCNQLEYQSGYLHSHLPRKNKYRNCEDFEEFCIGEGPMTLLVAQLNESLSEIPTRSNNMKLDLNLFELYFRHINTYIRWESLEGGPYIKMEEINNIIKITPINMYKMDLIRIYDFFKTKIRDIDCNFNFVIKDNFINIIYDDNFYSLINSVLIYQVIILKTIKDNISDLDWYINNNYTVTYLKDSNDVYYYSNHLNTDFFNINVEEYEHNLRRKSYFRNEEIKFKLEKFNDNEIYNKQYLHPHIYQYIKEQLTNYLNEQRFKQKYFSK